MNKPPTNNAFTLLEVILALGILAAALAVVGEVTRLSYVNAENAAMEGEAYLIAESVMAQLVAGLLEPVDLPATDWADGQQAPTWRYSMTVLPTEVEELLAVTVRVEQIVTTDQQPVTVQLVRWTLDPALIEEAASESEGS
ncbi:MAG: prepilin-type N-terminal cleavage/methylation domain-containing protein [Planctomycetota bacterium]